MSNTSKDLAQKDSNAQADNNQAGNNQADNEKESNEKDNNHNANPPGNPMLKQDDADLDKARQNEFAAAEEAKASQTANINQHNLPIKQPNKATNNS